MPVGKQGQERHPAIRRTSGPKCRCWYQLQRGSSGNRLVLLLPEFIGEALHVRFGRNCQCLPSSPGTPEQCVPFRVSRHVAPKSFTEQFADRPVFTLGKLLGFSQKIWRQSDRNGLGCAHTYQCKTMTGIVKCEALLAGRVQSEREIGLLQLTSAQRG